MILSSAFLERTLREPGFKKNPGSRKDSCGGYRGLREDVTRERVLAETAGINYLFLSLYFNGHAARIAIVSPKAKSLFFSTQEYNTLPSRAKMVSIHGILVVPVLQ